MISKQLQAKLDYYEQVYYALDEPIPFKEGLLIYPVKVKDYFRFYSCFPCLTMDKNTKMVIDENGRPKKVANPKGMAMNDLGYLIFAMEDKEMGPTVTAQVMDLFEMIFHIKKGLYCPHCGKEIEYAQIVGDMEKYVEEQKKNLHSMYIEAREKAQQQAEEQGIEFDEANFPKEIPQDIATLMENKARQDFIEKSLVCPDCGEQLRDVFSIKTEGKLKKLMVKDVEIGVTEFNELKAVVPRQNILDYDGDKYIDPDLKEELDLKAKLQNKDYTSPTLEKQLVCVAVGTGYTFEYLENITMRKLGLLLRTVDAKDMYYAQVQAAMSGFVKFKEDPKHWIFSENKKNIKDELTSLDSFAQKFSNVAQVT